MYTMNDRVIQSLNLPVSGLTLSRLPFSKQTHINPGQFKNTKNVSHQVEEIRRFYLGISQKAGKAPKKLDSWQWMRTLPFQIPWDLRNLCAEKYRGRGIDITCINYHTVRGKGDITRFPKGILRVNKQFIYSDDQRQIADTVSIMGEKISTLELKRKNKTIEDVTT